MADDRDKQAPTRQQPQVPTDSPYYSKDNMPQKCSPAAAWLLHRGWQCLGDPNWESAGWLPPGASEVEASQLVKKMGYFRRVAGHDKKGEPIVERVLDQIKQQDGANPMQMGQPVDPVVQLRVTPSGQLVSFRQAIDIQQAREDKDRRDRQTAKKVEAA